jgi:capsular polysaccharide export protein
MKRIALLTRGLWRLRHEIGALTGLDPVRWDALRRPAFDAVAGWGHAPTAARARRLAATAGKPYIAFEDGPLRSLRPGPSEPPAGMVMDRTGIYYEGTEPSDLLDLVAAPDGFTPEMKSRAEAALGLLRHLRLSKYNIGRERRPAALGLSLDARTRVLVLDQVHNDASIRGARADADAFPAMLAAARAENPEAEIVVKLHPDVLSGRRAGYFSELRARGGKGLTLIAEQVNPWSLLDAVDKVYTVSSGLGFESLVAGKTVVTFATPFYAGWGLTDDRRLKASRPRQAPLTEIFAAYYLGYTRYFDAFTRREIAFEDAAEQLAWLRDRFLEQAARPVCYRISRWKRASVDRMLDGPSGRPLHTSDAKRAAMLAKRTGGPVVAWASREDARLKEACDAAGVALRHVEDGFIRSAGLGASFVRPLSLAFDGRGIFYDSRQQSDLEAMLEEAEFPASLVERAARLREKLVAAGTTKYNVDRHSHVRIDSGGRPFVLVPGQVEDDASIEKGSPRFKRNVELLTAARARHPDAFVVYKPHPDVEAGFRRGRIPQAEARQYADSIVTRASILGLIEAADHIETMTSLAGFEALIRGKSVTTHGQPFYAGWGLTEDLCPVARRTRNRSLDELVAAALILYPTYLDPVSGLRCAPELLIDRLAAERTRERGPAEQLLRLLQISAARALHWSRAAKQMAKGGA